MQTESQQKMVNAILPKMRRGQTRGGNFDSFFIFSAPLGLKLRLGKKLAMQIFLEKYSHPRYDPETQILAFFPKVGKNGQNWYQFSL